MLLEIIRTKHSTRVSRVMKKLENITVVVNAAPYCGKKKGMKLDARNVPLKKSGPLLEGKQSRNVLGVRQLDLLDHTGSRIHLARLQENGKLLH